MFNATISACEKGQQWERALAVLEDARPAITSLLFISIYIYIIYKYKYITSLLYIIYKYIYILYYVITMFFLWSGPGPRVEPEDPEQSENLKACLDSGDIPYNQMFSLIRSLQ